MATVYTHIKSFQKRAINFFQQRLYRLGRAGQINSAVDELERKRVFFRKFRVSFGPSLTPEQQEYIILAADDVETRLQRALDERDLLEGILKVLNPCRACNGHGETITHLGQDDTRRDKCNDCDGTGVYKGTSSG